MNPPVSARGFWIAWFVFWIALLGCRTGDLIARNEPAATNTSTPRPTFTRVPPTVPPTVTPPPIAIPPTNPPPPRPPTPRPPTPRPAPTKVPPTAPPPAAPPTPNLDAGFYFRVTKIACVAGDNTRVEGSITDGGQPRNGVLVRVSGTENGPSAVDTTSGINPADSNRVDPSFTGKYRLGISEGQRISGSWYVFIVGTDGAPQSRNINVQMTQEPGCNTAIIDFAH